MSLLEIGLIAIGLSMDAFAVSLGKGLSMPRANLKAALSLAIAFGAFQAFMPVLGWLLASFFADAMRSVDHWIAFALLAIIGGKLIAESVRGEGDEGEFSGIRVGELLVLAVATSIDALAVGITFAALETPLMPAVAIIGLVTFFLSLAGVVAGNRFGAHAGRHAGVLGGVILIGIGVKVLVEHLLEGI